jgi:hypothetical protein
VHPLHGPELRALRPLQGQSPYVFVTEAETPVTTAWFLRWFSEPAKPLSYRFQFIHTCCGTQPDISWPTKARTPVRWRTILVTAICNRRLDTLRLRLIDLRDFGRTSDFVRAPGRGYQRDNSRGSPRRNGSPPIPAETGQRYSNYSLARLWLILAGPMASAINNLSALAQKRAEAPRGCGRPPL